MQHLETLLSQNVIIKKCRLKSRSYGVSKYQSLYPSDKKQEQCIADYMNGRANSMITNCKELYLKVHLEHGETIKQAIYI